VCSGDVDGKAQGTITILKWGALERLAYHDRSLDAVKIDYTDEKSPVRRVVPSSLALTHVALSIVDQTGFPDVDGDRFDFTRAEHVLTLDGATFDEVYAHVARLTPLPGRVKAAEDRKGKGGKRKAEPVADADDLDPGDGAADPSLTRSKRASRPRR